MSMGNRACCCLHRLGEKKKEVYITPLTIRFGALNPPNFKLGQLTPLTIEYRVINPLLARMAV
jgi:hypothetical protein